MVDFEVIEIVDDSNPYPNLLGIYWAIDMNGVINLGNRTMLFEKKVLRVIVLFDPCVTLDQSAIMKKVSMNWIKSIK